MWNLTTPITIPNVNRLDPLRVYVDGPAGTVTVSVDVLTVGGRRHDKAPFDLIIRNGQAQGVKANPGAGNLLDSIVVFTATTADPQGVTGLATIFDTIANAYEQTAGTRNAKLNAVQAALGAAGLFPPGS